MMLHPQQSTTAFMTSPEPPSLVRHGKRKALEVPDGNERLSKRLSLLNLERGGAKLYVPVESPRISPVEKSFPTTSLPATPYGSSPAHLPDAPVPAATLPPAMSMDASTVQQQSIPVMATPSAPAQSAPGVPDDDMRVDDSKYKVYIYDLDDELASSSENEADDGKLVFLPDIDKHLRDAARSSASGTGGSSLSLPKPIIPRPILPNEDGELAGMQLVLYHDPSSLSVPREQDSVRQAILDARARIRERQQEEKDRFQEQQDDMADDEIVISVPSTPPTEDPDAMDID